MITLKDIAEHAGVSTCTASHVLSGKHKLGRINEKTRKHVIEVAGNLGYRRNAIASAIKIKRSNIFGVMGLFSHQYHLQTINGISEEALENGYMFNFFIPARMAGETIPNRERAYQHATKMCIEQRVAGIIVNGPLQSELEAMRVEIGNFPMRVIVIASGFDNNWCSRVDSDDLHGAEMATSHLIRQGRKKVAHATADLQFGYVATRLAGYRRALKAYGVAEDENLILSGLQEGNASGNTVTIADFLKNRNPDAIFCSSDYFAANVTRAAMSLGMKIPDDLAVIGYGDLDLGRYYLPSLSSVSQPFQEMGRTAVKLILGQINSDVFEQKEIRLPVQLVLRESTEDNHKNMEDFEKE
jgi:DNA-binding LacI/PurR family transcriptional regulator